MLQAIARRVPLLRELPIEVTAISAVAFFVALGFGIVGPVIPAYAREFHVSAFAAGMVITVFATMRLLSAPGAARLCDKLGERWVLAVGLAIVSVSSLTAGLAQNYMQLVVFRGIGGIGSVMFSVSSMALLLRVVAPEYRGRAASAWSGGFLLGGLSGPALGGVLVVISLRAPFFFYALTTALGALLAWRSLRHAHLTENAVQDVSEPLLFRDAIRLRPYQTVIATQFGNGFVRFGIANALIALYVIQVLDASPALASAGFFVTSVAQALLLSKAGKWVDLVGRKPVLLAGIALTVLSQLLLMTGSAYGWFLLSMAILGLSGAFVGTVPAAMLGDVTGGAPRGSLVSASTMAGDLGGVVGPVVGGLVLDHTSSYPAAFSTGVALMAVALGLAILTPETMPKAEESA